MADVLSPMLSIVRARLNDRGRDWLDGALATARSGDVNRLCASYTAASRHAGTATLSLSVPERTELAGLLPDADFQRWTVTDAARAVVLLTAAAALAGDTFVAHALACFDNGDASEQQSWLRAIGLLPRNDRFTAVAVDSCRSHIQPTFESIACENPYPSAFFSDRQFNQLVLKAMFTGVRLDRIVGLARRLNADLSRMARDYAAERRAAGRTVPADLQLALHDAPALEEHLT
jgi:hypothetical protein